MSNKVKRLLAWLLVVGMLLGGMNLTNVAAASELQESDSPQAISGGGIHASATPNVAEVVEPVELGEKPAESGEEQASSIEEPAKSDEEPTVLVDPKEAVVKLTNSKFDVSVTADTENGQTSVEVVDPATRVKVKESEISKEAVDKLAELEGVKAEKIQYQSYDISLSLHKGDVLADGTVVKRTQTDVQPRGEVEVKLPIGDLEPYHMSVCHVDGEQVEKMKGWLEDEEGHRLTAENEEQYIPAYYVFPTTHFSNYTCYGSTTTLGGSSYGAELTTGYYVVSNSITYNNYGGGYGRSGLSIASGANVTIEVRSGCNLTCNGGSGSGTSGGGAGIYLPSNATLTLIGQGSVSASGGSSGNSYSGNGANSGYLSIRGDYFGGGSGGSGGSGAGGAGAGIGGRGGSGGSGGPGGSGVSQRSCSYGTDVAGSGGQSGQNGSSGTSMGTLYVLGSVHVYAYRGGSTGGGGGGYSGGRANDSGSGWENYYTGGGGGGGGGGGSTQAAATIGGGSGGAGGGGGGGGGGVFTSSSSHYYGGGAGGGGALGGSSGSSAEWSSYIAGWYQQARGGGGGGRGYGGSGGTVYRASTAYINSVNGGSTSNGYGAGASYYSNSNGSYTTGYGINLTLNGNGGSNGSATMPFGSSGYSSYSAATRNGYTLLGYYTSPNGGNRIMDNLGRLASGTVDGYISNGYWNTNVGRTLYARWQANTYYVAYNKNGGSGAMTNQTFTYDVSQRLSNCGFTRSGYEFLGWSTNPSITLPNYATATSGKYLNQQSVSNLVTNPNGTFNLYAVWRPYPTVTVKNLTTRYGTNIVCSYGKASTDTIGYNGDGTASVSSSKPEYATVSVNNSTKKISITAVSPGTTTITITFASTANWSKLTKTFQITVMPAALSNQGNTICFDGKTNDNFKALIDGETIYGQKLTASLVSDNQAFQAGGSKRAELERSIVYCWYRVYNGVERCVGTGSEYTCQSDDIGSKIEVKISGFGEKYQGDAVCYTDEEVTTTEPSFDPVFHYIYANGMPIRIVSNGNGGTLVQYDPGSTGNYTSMQSTNNEELPANLSDWTIVGGYKNSRISGANSIVMTGGCVKALYGAGQAKDFTGDATITISGGEVVEDVYGGSQTASMTGNATVTISGGVVGGSIYGGCYSGATNGNTVINLRGGKVGGCVYAGGNTTISDEGKIAATVTGTKNVFVSGDLSQIVAVDLSATSDSHMMLDGNLTGRLSLTIPAEDTRILTNHKIDEGTVVVRSKILSYLNSVPDRLEIKTTIEGNPISVLKEGYHYGIEEDTVVATHHYKLELNKNGGVGGANSFGVTYGEVVGSMSQTEFPEKENYQFGGYFASPTGGTGYIDNQGNGLLASYSDLAVTTLYARWEPCVNLVAQSMQEQVTAGQISESISVEANNGDGSTTENQALRYQWYSCKSDGSDVSRMDGKTQATMMLPTDMKAGKLYYYYCEVSNGSEIAEPVNSKLVTVEVLGQQTLFMPTAGTLPGYYEDSIELLLSANSQNQDVSIYYTISKDTPPLAPYVDEDGVPGMGAVLFEDSTPIEMNEVGTYYIKAIVVKENCVNSNVATFVYQIAEKPVITFTKQPESIARCLVGDAIQLNAEAVEQYGRDVSYQWYQTDAGKRSEERLAGGNNAIYDGFAQDNTKYYFVRASVTVNNGKKCITKDSDVVSVTAFHESVNEAGLMMPKTNVSAGTYYTKQLVTLSSENEASEHGAIYYTTDGVTDPSNLTDPAVVRYSEGDTILIDGVTTCTLQAVYVEDDTAVEKTMSDVAAYMYEVKSPRITVVQAIVEQAASADTPIEISVNVANTGETYSYQWYSCEANGSNPQEVTTGDGFDEDTYAIEDSLVEGSYYYICRVTVGTEDATKVSYDSDIICVNLLGDEAVYAPSTNLAPGNYDSASIELSSQTPEAKIYYQTGTNLEEMEAPDSASTLFTGTPIEVTDSGMFYIKAVAYAPDDTEHVTPSSVTTFAYGIRPEFEFVTTPMNVRGAENGVTTVLQAEAINRREGNPTIKYQWYETNVVGTIDIKIDDPSAKTTSYAFSSIEAGEHYLFCRAYTELNGELFECDSPIATVRVLERKNQTADQDKQLKMPIASLNSGTYYTKKEVALTTANPELSNATIYYTLDGSDPRDAENLKRVLYDDAFICEEDSELRAVCIEDTTAATPVYSNIASYTYKIQKIKIDVAATLYELIEGYEDSAELQVLCENIPDNDILFAWYQDGIAIEGADEETYTVPSGMLADEHHIYTCQVSVGSNPAEQLTQTTESIEVRVLEATALKAPTSSQPSEIVEDGTEIELHTDIDSSDAIIYYTMKVGEEPEDPDLDPDVSPNTKTFQSGGSLSIEGAGMTYIKAIVSYDGKVSQVASFWYGIKPRIQITRQPESVTVETEASLAVEGSEEWSKPLTYQWYRTNTLGTDFEKLADATAATYTYCENVPGDYYVFCRVSAEVDGLEQYVDSEQVMVRILGESSVAMPQASLLSNTYHADLDVTLSCDTSDVAVYYTVDDSDPRTSLTRVLYLNSFTVSQSCNLRMVAYKDGVYSNVGVREYQIKAPEIELTDTNVELLYKDHVSSQVTVDIADNACEQISYAWYACSAEGVKTGTCLGSDSLIEASCNGAYGMRYYICEVGISGTGLRLTTYDSDIMAVNYRPIGSVKAVTFASVLEENGDRTVTVTSGTENAILYYTLDGSNPTKEDASVVNGGEIVVRAEDTATTKELRVLAAKEGYVDSSIVVTSIYVEKPYIDIWTQAENVRLESGYRTPATLSIAAKQIGNGSLSYTWYCCDSYGNNAVAIAGTEGSGMNTNQYTLPLGCRAGYYYYYCKVESDNPNVADQKSEVTEVYIVPLGKVENPQVSVEAGVYKETQYVEITTKTAGAQIYYTTDRSVPSPGAANTSKYTGPLTITNDTQLRILATKDNYTDSDLIEVNYTISCIVITQQPTDLRLVENHIKSTDCVSVSADINIPGDIYYKWYQCSASGVTEQEVVGSKSTFAIPTTLKADGVNDKNYYFICQVYNKDVYSVDSRIVKVTIQPSVENPTIEEQVNGTIPSNYDQENNCYYDGVKVTLDCVTEGSQILYTLDGSEPDGTRINTGTPATQNYPTYLYTNTFLIPAATTADRTVTIKTKGTKVGTIDSGTVSKTYQLKRSYIQIQEQPMDQKVVYSEILPTNQVAVRAIDKRTNTISYQWYSCKADKTGGVAVAGATSNTMTLNPDLTVGNYYYYCKMNCVGSSTQPVDTDIVTITVSREILGGLQIAIEDWSYGNPHSEPVITGNLENGETEIYYKLDGGEFAPSIPTAVGHYTARLNVYETANYQAGQATCEFTITPTVAGVTNPDETVVYYKSLNEAIAATNAVSGSALQVIENCILEGDACLQSDSSMQIPGDCVVQTGGGASLTVEGRLTNNGVLEGTIINKATLINEGYLVGTIDNHLVIESTSGGGTLGKEGKYTTIRNDITARLYNGIVAAGTMIENGEFTGFITNNGETSNATILGTVDNTGTIDGGTFVSGAGITGGILAGDIDNHTGVKDVVIAKGGTLSGGSVQGTITGDGTLNNLTIEGTGSVSGGIQLTGTIINEGSIREVSIEGVLDNIKGNLFGGVVKKTGIVSGGNVWEEITNVGVISGAGISGGVINDGGSIKDGVLFATASVTGGAITGTVENFGEVNAATVNGSIKNVDDGSITDGIISQFSLLEGGTIDGAIINQGTISGAAIEGRVDNTVSAKILNANVQHNGLVTGGRLSGEIQNHGKLSTLTIARGSTLDNFDEEGILENVIIEGDVAVSGGVLQGEANRNEGILTGTKITGTLNNTNGVVKDIEISEGGDVNGGIAKGTIESEGNISQLHIEENTTITGGYISDCENDGIISRATVVGNIINNGEIKDATIEKNGQVTGGILSGDTKNTGKITGSEIMGQVQNADGEDKGTLENATIGAETTVTGGILAGASTNKGTITDGEIQGTLNNADGTLTNATVTDGATVSGGKLDGTTTNTGKIVGSEITGQVQNADGENKGTLEDATIGAETTVTGGILAGASTNKGTITDGEILGTLNNADGTLTNATVTEGATVSGGKLNGTTTNTGKITGSEITGRVQNADGENKGTLEDATIGAETTVTGGILAGASTNKGTVTDGEIQGTLNNADGTLTNATVTEGATVSGGKLNGTTTNTGKITGSEITGQVQNADGENKGTLENARIGKETTVTGGEIGGASTNQGTIVDGKITGTLNNTEGSLSNATVAKEATVNGGILSGTTKNVGKIVGSELSGTIENTDGTDKGTLDSVTITKDSKVTGGTVAGTTTNKGTITESVVSGVLTNTEGTLEDATVELDTVVSGGTLTGTTTNQGTLQGCTLYGTTNNTGGTVRGGVIELGATLRGGTLTEDVNNSGRIEYVYIYGSVTNTEEAVITGGTIEKGASVIGGTVDDNVKVNGTYKTEVSAKMLGKRFSVKYFTYKITKVGKKPTVTVVKLTKSGKKKKKLTIGKTVTYKNVKYTITAISTKAFYKNKKATKITVGSQVVSFGKLSFSKCSKLKTVKLGTKVKTIGTKAFYQSKKLATIQISGKRLAKVGKNAFKGISKKATVTVSKKLSKKVFKKYKKILKKKTGLVKSVRIKKK